ncbi:hypothetical protein TNCT_597261 [Trichonephila clavata]|uniref:Uncharacterized protein n=1 Tax=Trichonephila clavata TaxID=2740835 RepID=A0A8X6LN40_TRICU|nr:hypothetical protein TNCT_597261 [Trichonephila clavata]
MPITKNGFKLRLRLKYSKRNIFENSSKILHYRWAQLFCLCLRAQFRPGSFAGIRSSYRVRRLESLLLQFQTVYKRSPEQELGHNQKP